MGCCQTATSLITMEDDAFVVDVVDVTYLVERSFFVRDHQNRYVRHTESTSTWK